MVGKPGSGRRAGFKHSEETKQKISATLRGVPLTEERREHIKQGKRARGLRDKCILRFQELKANYPEQEEFFQENEGRLLLAMRNVRTEKELRDIRKYIETAALHSDMPYQYASSSYQAAEDTMIELLDFKRYLQKFH